MSEEEIKELPEWRPYGIKTILQAIIVFIITLIGAIIVVEVIK